MVTLSQTIKVSETTEITLSFDTRDDARTVLSGGTGTSKYVQIGDLKYVYDPVGTALVTGDGRTWSPADTVITPAHFGALGVKCVGDISVVGVGGITDETDKLQAMFDFALLTGRQVDMGPTDRDYGISAPIVIDPQSDRNRGDLTATADLGLLALHFSNMPSVMVKNAGNARIVALSAMDAMFQINNLAAAYNSTAPYWTVWEGMNLHGNSLATVGFSTVYSYRHKYKSCRVFGCAHGWSAINDAGSLWDCCEINCTESGIYTDNAGDLTIRGGDIFVQKDGIRCGGGNNTRVMGVTFTGNEFSDPDMVAVRLFGGSTVTANPRTRSVHVTGCEGAGIDWLVKGDDADADGTKEIWGITLTDNHIVRNTFRPDIGLCYIRNGYGISLSGNNHGDLLNTEGTGPSVYLENVETFMIEDTFHGIEGTAIQLESCNGGSISSVFSNCATTDAEPIILMNNTTEVVAIGNSCRWRAASPAVTAFVEETGTSNRNRASENAIDTSKLLRPYIRLGAQSCFEHKYYGSFTFNPGTVAGGAGGTETGITVTGARLGDTVSLFPGENLKGLQLDGYITADNLVNMSYKNETGGGQTITSSTMMVEVRSR